MGEAKFVFRSSCTQLANPKTGPFIRMGDMTGVGGLFKAAPDFIARIDE